MIPEEQANKIKEQLIAQIEKSFPDDRKEFAKNQIQGMDSEQLEAFLKQNNLIAKEGNLSQGAGQGQQGQGCVFCSIATGDIKSYKIGENSKAIAVLEINPVSRGHTIIIPKDHLAGKENLPKEAEKLADSVSKKIKEKLKPDKIKTSSSNLFGHETINIIPVYAGKEVDENSEKSQANPEELLELQKTLLTKATKPKPISKTPKPKKVKAEKLWLPRRIP